MIAKDSVNIYLNKEYNDYTWMKNMSNEDLNNLYTKSDLKLELYKHQKIGSIIGSIENSFFYTYDMSLGKSAVILDILSKRKKEWDKCLILSPNVTTVSAFADEIVKHSNFSFIELVGTKEERLQKLKQDASIYILNYTGLLILNTVTYKKKWVIDDKALKNFAKNFQAVIYDESHKMKNYRNLTFNVCKELSKQAHLRYLLTGTPLNKDPIDLWSQFYLCDLGETLGRSISFYRQVFFEQKKNYWGGFEYKLRKEMKEDLNRIIKHKSLRYSKEEALDLPEKILINMKIEMSEEIKKLYCNTESDMLSYSGDYQKLEHTFVKMRQLCSGFLYFINDENEKVSITIDENNKLEELIEIINSIPDGDQVVVFLDFIRSGEIISEKLKQNKIKHLRLFSGTKDKIGTKNSFINDPSIKALICNTQSGGIGLNMQNASFCVFYELPLSSISYLQASDRCHRPGSKKSVTIYNFITKDSVEEKILQYLNDGKKTFTSLIEGVAKDLRKKIG